MNILSENVGIESFQNSYVFRKPLPNLYLLVYFNNWAYSNSRQSEMVNWLIKKKKISLLKPQLYSIIKLHKKNHIQ